MYPENNNDINRFLYLQALVTQVWLKNKISKNCNPWTAPAPQREDNAGIRKAHQDGGFSLKTVETDRAILRRKLLLPAVVCIFSTC